MAANQPDFNANLTTGVFPPLGPATTQKAIEPRGWDRCTLGPSGQVVPGYCRILDASCGLKKDPKPKGGADGANTTWRGVDPKPLRMEITTFNDPDREALAALLAPYIPIPGRTPTPLAIDHPSLRMIQVYAVVIENVGALIPVEGTTKAKMTIAMQHWLPTKNRDATATLKSAPVRKPKNNRKSAPDPTKGPGFGQPPGAMGNGQ